MTTPQLAVPEQTALQVALTQHTTMLAAVTAAVAMLEDQRRRRPLGLTVNDQAMLDGLATVQRLLPLLIGYATQVQTDRDALSARVAGADTTAGDLQALITGLMASWAAPGTPGLVAPTLPVIYTTQQAWQDGATAGWQAAAARNLQRVADRLA